MKRLLWIIIIILVVATGSTGYGTALKIRDGMIDLLLPPVIPAAPKSKAIQDARPKRTANDYQKIVDRNLFGTKSDNSQNAKPLVNLDSLEKTRLNLRLWGTSVTVGLTPSAVIEDVEKGKQGLYRVGDTVQGAALQMVFKDRVVLRHNGRDEVLEMADPSKRAKSTRRRSPAVRSRAPRSRTPQKGTPGRRVGIERQQLTEAMQDIPALMRQIRITPHATGGEADGLNVSNIKPGSIFFQAGLKNGDIIRSINGAPVKSMSDVMNAVRNSDMAGPVKLEIQRRRRIETIEYTIK